MLKQNNLTYLFHIYQKSAVIKTSSHTLSYYNQFNTHTRQRGKDDVNIILKFRKLSSINKISTDQYATVCDW